MARGKHGLSAATRHAIESRDTEISTYKAAVAKLTAENKALRDRLDSQQQTSAREVRRLKAERNEGVSPMLAMVQRENASLKGRLDLAERAIKEFRKNTDRIALRLMAHFESEHGLTRTESVEKWLNISSEDGVDRLMVDGKDTAALGARSLGNKIERLPDGFDRIEDGPDVEGMVRIQRARGERR